MAGSVLRQIHHSPFIAPFEVHKRGILEVTMLWNRRVSTQNGKLFQYDHNN